MVQNIQLLQKSDHLNNLLSLLRNSKCNQYTYFFKTALFRSAVEPFLL